MLTSNPPNAPSQKPIGVSITQFNAHNHEEIHAPLSLCFSLFNDVLQQVVYCESDKPSNPKAYNSK